MDAIEFLKEYARMCAVNKDCYGCPLKGTDCSLNREFSEEQMINIVDKTEQWSKEHPVMTNAQKFKEVFGFIPADHTTLFHLHENDFGIMAIEWDKPYEGAEI